MKLYNLNELIKIVPNSIKVELLKKELLNIYKIEKDVDINLKKRGMDFNKVSSFYRDRLCNEIYSLAELNTEISNFIVLIEISKLQNEEIIELYRWAKKIRKEMDLKDNLFNLFEGFIIGDLNTYDEINEEMNKHNIL